MNQPLHTTSHHRHRQTQSAALCALAALACVCGAVRGDTRPEPVNAIGGYTNTPFIPGTEWHVHDPNRPQPAWEEPRYDGKPVPPPPDATVLFDGSGLQAWKNTNWPLVDGAMQAGKGKQVSLQEFGDMHLHLEFRIPVEPGKDGQKPGNSGVFLMDRYEIQVLNSYDNRTCPDGQCAAMYGQKPPDVNASRKPGEWQSYDIHFKAPVFEDGKLLSPACVTVFHNNIKVHDNIAFIGPSSHKVNPPYKPHPAIAPISLQDHGSPVQYRNIWVAPLTLRLGTSG